MKLTSQGIGARSTTAGMVGLSAVALVAVAAAPGHAAASAVHPRAHSHATAGTAGLMPEGYRLFDSRAAAYGSANPVHGLVQVTTTSDVPSGASVVLSVTATGATGIGDVVAYADGAALPSTSILNYSARQTIAAPAIVAVPDSGVVDLDVEGAPTALVVDEIGYYNAGDFNASSPTRIADSRTGSGISKGTKTGTVTVPLGDIPANDGTVALTVTATGATGAGYVQLGTGTSALNYVKGQNIANLVYAKVTAGAVTLTVTGAPTNLVVDLDGYAPTGSVVAAVTPVRLADSRIAGDGFSSKTLSGAVTLRLNAQPAGTTAVLLNVTVPQATANEYVIGYSGQQPAISELAYAPGTIRANLIEIPIASGQTSVTLFFKSPVEAFVDYEGAVGTVAASS